MGAPTAGSSSVSPGAYPDKSAGKHPAQIQENMVAYMRLFADLPGMTMHDAETFWFVSGKPAPGNAILRALWPEGDPDDHIDELLGQVSQHIERIDWLVFPGDRPRHLNQLLEARGMPGSRGGNWLLAGLASLAPPPAAPPGFHIEQVCDDRALAEWVRVSEEGFGEELGWFYDAYARHGYGTKAFSLHYTGYLGDVPVTSGTLLDAGGCASIYDVSTLPAYRRQGFGGALTHFLMREIARRGYRDTWIWSSNMGKSLYQKLGYIEVDFGMREHTWELQEA